MMMLAQPSAPIIYDVVYSKNITNRWCAQEIFTSFFNTLTSLQGQSPVHILKQQFEALFVSIFLNPNSMSNPNQMTELFYKLIVYTRDIKALGHYTHGYMLVVELFKFGNKYETQVNKDTIQNNAFLLFESFVKNYGSWKDVKYFLNYYVEELHKAKSPNLSNDFFINKIIKMVCKQIKENSNSLIAKWLPREKSNKFGWQTQLIAREYYSEWFSENMSEGQYKAATRKSLTHFRQLISSLNKKLNTTQTYQCNNNWSQIDFNKDVTKNTMYKQKKAFNCVNKMMSDNQKYKDRVQCKVNYNNRINKPIAESTVQPMTQSIKSWETIVKELTNNRYNDLDVLKKN
jgi:hypothetical protein